jgi:hypothetical protein
MESQSTDRMVLVNIKVIEWNHNLQTGWYWSISRLYNGITIYRHDGTGQYQGYRMESQFTEMMVLVNIKVIEWNHNL